MPLQLLMFKDGSFGIFCDDLTRNKIMTIHKKLAELNDDKKYCIMTIDESAIKFDADSVRILEDEMYNIQ